MRPNEESSLERELALEVKFIAAAQALLETGAEPIRLYDLVDSAQEAME